MSKPYQYLVEVKAMMECEGLTIKSTKRSTSGHFRVVTLLRGQEHFFMVPSTPSCRRSFMNLRSAVRQYVKGATP